MNAYIFDIKRFAVHDGPGIRTTVFFQGCPLSCLWCHNPESIKQGSDKLLSDPHYTKVRKYDLDDLLLEIKKDFLYYDESQGGVTFSGGEPFQQFDSVLELAKKCKEESIHICLDTSLFVDSDKLKQILHVVDLYLLDIKCVDNDLHKELCGVPNTIILKNIKLILDAGKQVRVRFPLIPGINSTPKHIEDIIDFLHDYRRQIKVDILPYHKIAAHKYDKLGFTNHLKNIEEPDDIAVLNIRDQFEIAGFTTSIGG